MDARRKTSIEKIGSTRIVAFLAALRKVSCRAMNDAGDGSCRSSATREAFCSDRHGAVGRDFHKAHHQGRIKQHPNRERASDYLLPLLMKLIPLP